MALTITKSKQSAPKTAPLPKVDTTFVDVTKLSDEDLADRYGDLKDRTEALMQYPEFAQFAEIQKELNKRLAEKVGATDTATLKGQHWLLEIGACAKSPRKLIPGAMEILYKMLGTKTFMAIASVTLGDIDKYLNPEQAAKVVDPSVSYTTKRTVVAKHIG